MLEQSLSPDNIETKDGGHTIRSLYCFCSHCTDLPPLNLQSLHADPNQCLVVVFFISSSSAPTIDSSSVRNKYDQFKGQWKPKPPTPGAGQKPTTGGSKVTQEDFENAGMPKGAAEKATDVVADKDKSKDKSTGSSTGKSASKPAEKASDKPLDRSKEKSTGKTSGTRVEDTSPNRQGTLGSAKAPGPRMNATFVTLARNSDLYEIVKSIRQVEDRFNHRYGYDWVFLNDAPFDDDFKKVTSNLVSGKTRYGLIPEDHWSFPEWIDQDKAAAVRKDMAERKIIYGDSISYRHMCRYESGFFFRHEIMKEYEWYWRVEPSIELFCDIEYDTFEYMAKNDKKYSFVISLYEYIETIPTMWDSVKTFMKEHPEHLAKDNSMDFLSDDNGKTYNKCHFVSCEPLSLLCISMLTYCLKVVQLRDRQPRLPTIRRLRRLLRPTRQRRRLLLRALGRRPRPLHRCRPPSPQGPDTLLRGHRLLPRPLHTLSDRREDTA